MPIAVPDWIFNPIMFEIGPFVARWYGFMYALSFILGYLFLHYSKPGKSLKLKAKDLDTFIVWIILGILLGGRIGYILFYNLAFYIENPVKILAVWEGGMSFHGGLLGVVIALVLFSKKKKRNLWQLSDVITSFVPLGVMLVRIANFINAELYGRIATENCIYFPTDPSNCRYPSQIYQALLEGLILFVILQIVIHKKPKTGTVSALFLVLYGIFRIFMEQFRQPDAQIGFLWGGITQGQLLSIFMVLAGIILFILRPKLQKDLTK